MTWLIIFIFGLIIGSFLNAVIFRLKLNEQFIRGRSKCLNCQNELKAWDLIPVLSFIFLKGKCRYCHKAISWQYPLLELATGLVFLLGYFNLSYIKADFVFSYLTFIVFACFLIIIFIYDLKYYLILDKVSLPAFTIALILNVLLGYNVGNLLLASVIIGGFFGLQFIISQGKWIGGGDIRLGLVMGAMLGWPLALVALFLAYILGAVFGLILIISRRKDWQSQLPFGTFLTAATLIALLWGHEILSWYLTKL